MASLRRFLPRLSPAPAGFTLVELLLTVVLGGLLVAATAVVLVGATRARRGQQTILQLRSSWARLTTLLAAEVGEGSRLQSGVTTSGCSSTQASLLTITVPVDTPSSATLNTRQIHYYLQATADGPSLRRCGPPILASGSLDATATTPVDAELVSGLTLAAAVDAVGTSVTFTPDPLVLGSTGVFSLHTGTRLIE